MRNNETEMIGTKQAAVVDANNEFAFTLYRQTATARSENLFFSPFSISTALTMMFAGAGGRTKQEMAAILGLKDDPAVIHPRLARLIKAVFSSELHDCRISLANRIWAQAGYRLRSEHVELLKKYYGAGLESLDLRGQPKSACQVMNRWVAEQTEGNIENLISPQDLNELTRIVLINAIYFKGQWTAPFRSANTSDARFFVSPSRRAGVKMMHQENRFAYGCADGVQILELPYGKKVGLSMVVLLPRRFGGLAKLQRSLSVDTLNRWLTALAPRVVRVYLPRFRIRERIMLVPALRAMGMVAACSETEADFSGISGQQPGLCISSVIHEAFVEVDEKGTEAAAATAVLGALMLSRIHLPPRIPVFRADHPFIFLIRHVESGTVLFLGRVMNPLP
jgi:serpin B